MVEILAASGGQDFSYVPSAPGILLNSANLNRADQIRGCGFLGRHAASRRGISSPFGPFDVMLGT